MEQLYAHYPAMLRELDELHPGEKRPTINATVYSKIQCDIVTAVWAAEQPGYNSFEEFTSRKIAFREAADKELERSRLARLLKSHAHPKRQRIPAPPSDRLIASFDVSKHQLTPKTGHRFWEVIGDEGVPYKKTTTEDTHCELHDNGPYHISKLSILAEQLNSIPPDGTDEEKAQRKLLLGQQDLCQRKCNEYRLAC